MPASRLLQQVHALVEARRLPDAASLLMDAATRGDADAMMELAHWRIAGDIVRRDLAAARLLLGRAASAGSNDAALLHAQFLASGTGGADDWAAAVSIIEALARNVPEARAQLALIQKMAVDHAGYPSLAARAEPLSESPFVTTLAGLLTPAECRYIRDVGEAALQPSVVVDPATRRLIPHPIRTSDGTAFGVYAEDLVVNAINRRIAAASSTTIAQGEPLQLLRYQGGQEYRPHMDALPAEQNQRVLTMLLYLSDDYVGGETHFPRTGLSFRGKAGDALLFRNVTADGRADAMSLHAGLPVTQGTKLIATRWIRRERFTYPPPQPLLDR
jgi:prolyl 4-hydroxylase